MLTTEEEIKTLMLDGLLPKIAQLVGGRKKNLTANEAKERLVQKKLSVKEEIAELEKKLGEVLLFEEALENIEKLYPKTQTTSTIESKEEVVAAEETTVITEESFANDTNASEEEGVAQSQDEDMPQSENEESEEPESGERGEGKIEKESADSVLDNSDEQDDFAGLFEEEEDL